MVSVKGLFRLILILVSISAILSGFLYFTYVYPFNLNKEVVEIQKGEALRSIASKLERKEVIRNDELFIFFVFVRGEQGKLKAGEYEFPSGYSIADVINKIVAGDVVVRRVTIPEGLTMKEISELLERKGILSGENFLEKAEDSEFATELIGYSVPNLEGYLYPETYAYTRGVTPEELIRAMTSRFKKVFASLENNKENINLTDREIVTLASIIEKETAVPSERPLISAVFHNRLERGMGLYSDPTVIYGLGSDFDGNLTKKDLRINSEYNTYLYRGLPPGPISNPGAGSLASAVNPAEVDFLYFVAKGDGTHEFTSNLRDHIRAVNKYQRKR